MPTRAVHPHVCGENSPTDNQIFQRNGSPPRVWGKRFTGFDLVMDPSGSPPRVWGKRVAAWVFFDAPRFTPTCVGKTYVRPRAARRQTRFTPTCVGKTNRASLSASVTAVHPHVCGENSAWGTASPTLFGSPPRVWGKPPFPSATAGATRFTPTCVGKTIRRSVLPADAAVHPHVCGENSRSIKNTFYCIRFTPTCVGKTFSR